MERELSPASERELPTRAERDADQSGAPASDDGDKATNLGSAFHELAQAMVESGGVPSPEHVRSMEDHWRLSSRASAKLEAALVRWRDSDIRREACGHGLVRAEVPFFSAAESRFGSYVEGAIDLIATDAGSSAALVVDYKTGDAGLSTDEIRARHEMQANFYAAVLMWQGFSSVACAFVCVELDDGSGQPVVVRYEFGAENLPQMG
jgi:ATP-dependent exoDNAse (exonuclease V) beta subunit